MQRGYVKLWRKSIDTGWLQNHKLWVFWCWCLMKASYTEYDLVVGCQQVHLMPGDFVFGRKKASKELKISEQSIRTFIDFLKTSKNITTKPTNKFTIISIVNWNTYQDQETITNQPLTNNQPTTNHKQECKEYKNINNNINRIKFSIPTIKEITLYCQQRKNQINAQNFADYYTANGWMVGKNKMKDWKAAVRTWEQRSNENGNVQGFITNTYRKNYNNRELDPAIVAETDRITKEYEAKLAASAGENKQNTG